MNSVIVLNCGEASVKYADVLSRNGTACCNSHLVGNIHLINSVLIPTSGTLLSDFPEVEVIDAVERMGSLTFRSLF